MDDNKLFTMAICLAMVLSLIGFIFFHFNDAAKENGDKDKAIRTAKIEACRTVTDEGMRTLCIIEAGGGTY